jgi:hypothetical protein
MCCGFDWPPKKKRRPEAPIAEPQPAAIPYPAENEVPLRLLGERPLVLRGPATGRIYTFEKGGVLKVDSRDRDSLLRTRLFAEPGLLRLQ